MSILSACSSCMNPSIRNAPNKLITFNFYVMCVVVHWMKATNKHLTNWKKNEDEIKTCITAHIQMDVRACVRSFTYACMISIFFSSVKFWRCLSLFFGLSFQNEHPNTNFASLLPHSLLLFISLCWIVVFFFRSLYANIYSAKSALLV